MAQNRKLQNLIEPNHVKGGVSRLTGGQVPICYIASFMTAGAADVDIVVDRAFTVIDAWARLDEAGTAGDTITVKGGTDVIMTAIDISSGGNKDIVRAAEIDNDHAVMTAGETLRVSLAAGGDAAACEVYILGILS